MEGAEQEIIATHVADGTAKLVYWPMLDLGPNSLNSATAAFCAGEQSPEQFWQMHDTLYENQRSVYVARTEFFRETAASLGLDMAAFDACYESEAMRDEIRALDEQRRSRGITVRPTIVIGDERIFGSQPFEVFDAAIRAQLEAGG